MNAFTIQKKIRGQDTVSTLWVQTEFGVNYKMAKEFLLQLQKRGWIGKNSSDFHYPVRKENLRLRSISRLEVDDLCEAITTSGAKALRIMLERDGAGSMALKMVTRGEGDTLEVLQEHDLCYYHDGLYFSCVSTKAVKVLDEVADYKRHRSVRRHCGINENDNSELWDLFEPLFDGESE